MKARRIYMAGAFTLTLGVFAIAYAQNQWTVEEREHEIPYSELPEAVRTAAEEILGSSGDYEAETEVEEGVRWYEVETERDGKEISFKFTADGVLVEREEEVSFDALPEAVQRELNKNYPGADFNEIEAVELHYYEVELRINGREREIRIFASGDIEDDDDEEDDDEDDDDDEDGD